MTYTSEGLRVEHESSGRLIALSATRFVVDGGHTYEFDDRGRMRVTDEFGTVTQYDKVEPAKPSAKELEVFTGSYSNDELETTFTLNVEGSTLVLRRRSEAPTALKPAWPDAFALGPAWVISRRDVSGRVVAFSISGERMWDLSSAGRAHRMYAAINRAMGSTVLQHHRGP